MTHGTDNTVRPGYEPKRDPKFPHAPIDWSPEDAEKLARTESLTLTEDH
jgi:tRNA 2-thiouridine synthesizing protein E